MLWQAFTTSQRATLRGEVAMPSGRPADRLEEHNYKLGRWRD